MFLDESGFRLQPLNRRTWAPVGSRPQQIVSQRHDRLSVIGSLSVAPQQRRLRPHFVVQDRNVRTRDVMRYLRQLHRIHRRPLIVVMDRLNVHRSAVRKLHGAGRPGSKSNGFRPTPLISTPSKHSGAMPSILP